MVMMLQVKKLELKKLQVKKLQVKKVLMVNGKKVQMMELISKEI